MKVTPETVDDIVAIIAHTHRTFGGGRGSSNNPIAEALKNNPPQFAAGVDVKAVVLDVLALAKQLPKKTKVEVGS